MDWSQLIVKVAIPTALCSWMDVDIEGGDVELINGKYILHSDQLLSITLNNNVLELMEIRPEPNRTEFELSNGRVVIRGGELDGGYSGIFEIGVYHPGIKYPLYVICLQLAAPFHFESTITKPNHIYSEIKLRLTSVTNKPNSESKEYPFRLQCNTSTTEDGWQDLDYPIQTPSDLHWIYYSLTDEHPLFAYYLSRDPLRFRLRSARGRCYSMGAICKKDEIIRFLDNSPSLVPLSAWIEQPNVFDIPHQKYKFDSEKMIEEWNEFPKITYSSALEWLSFEPLSCKIYEANMSHRVHDEQLKISARLDFKNNLEEVEDISSLVGLFGFNVNNRREHAKFSNNFIINGNSIKFEAILSLPKSESRMKRYFAPSYLRSEEQSFFTSTPFEKTNWDLMVNLTFPHNNLEDHTSLKIIHWKNSFISNIANRRLESLVNPSNMTLHKCIFESIDLSRNMFCPKCGTLAFPDPKGKIVCTNNDCNFTNSKPKLVDLKLIEDEWYENSTVSSLHNHEFSYISNLEKSDYIIAYNGMGFRFSME